MIYEAPVLSGEEMERLLAEYECGNEGLAAEAKANAANVLDLNFMEPVGGWALVKHRSVDFFRRDRAYFESMFYGEGIYSYVAAEKREKWPVPSAPCVLYRGKPALCVYQWVSSRGSGADESEGVILVGADGSRNAVSWSAWGESGRGSFAKEVSVMPKSGAEQFMRGLRESVGKKFALAHPDGRFAAYSMLWRARRNDRSPVPFLVADPFGATWFDGREQAEKFAELTFGFELPMNGGYGKAHDVELAPVEMSGASRAFKKGSME